MRVIQRFLVELLIDDEHPAVPDIDDIKRELLKSTEEDGKDFGILACRAQYLGTDDLLETSSLPEIVQLEQDK